MSSLKSNNEKQRLAKWLAHAGVASRRQAEVLIEEKKVSVNGEVVTTPAFFVDDNDLITVDGKKISAFTNHKIWLYHKPYGYVTTHHDPEGRETVFEDIKRKLSRHVMSVGRLDQNSEGLLLISTNGDFVHYAESPKTGWERVYKVRVYGNISQDQLNQLVKGIVVDGMHYQASSASVLSQGRSNTWILITLKEGKNREIRHMMAAFDLKINRLIRILYGPYELGDLKPGELKEVQFKDYKV